LKMMDLDLDKLEELCEKAKTIPEVFVLSIVLSELIERVRKAEKLAEACKGLQKVVGAGAWARYDAWKKFTQALAEWEGQ